MWDPHLDLKIVSSWSIEPWITGWHLDIWPSQAARRWLHAKFITRYRDRQLIQSWLWGLLQESFATCHSSSHFLLLSLFCTPDVSQEHPPNKLLNAELSQGLLPGEAKFRHSHYLYIPFSVFEDKPLVLIIWPSSSQQADPGLWIGWVSEWMDGYLDVLKSRWIND